MLRRETQDNFTGGGFAPLERNLNRWMSLLCYKKDNDFPGSLEGKEPPCNEGHPGSVPGLGRSPGEGNGNPLQHPCLENPMDRGAL